VRLNPLLAQLRTYPQEALNQKKAEVRARGLTLYDFGTGDPVEPTPERIREALVDAVPLVSQYPTVRGSRRVREAIAGYCQRRFDLTLDPDTQILPTSGSKEAVFHLPFLVIDPNAPDRTVVFPDPGYPAYQRGTLFAGGECHIVSLGGDWHQRPWKLPEAVLAKTRILWVNSPHNPSGAVMSLDDLARTYEVCRQHDILLASDECYADVYDREPPPSALQVGTEGILVFHSCSKRSGMTGYRSGFVAGDPAWIEAFREFRINPGVVPQDTVNAGAVVAWSDDSHSIARRDLLRLKKDMFRAFFAEVGLEVVASEATFYFWIRTPKDMDEEAYASRLLEAGIVVSPGSYFGFGEVGTGYVRVAMVPPLEQCSEAIAVWRQVHEEEGWIS
jgi:LL-diaminopimelate aminotransferase